MAQVLPSACVQVRERLGEASAPKVRAQLAALLQAALRGAAANPSATADDIAVFVYSTLEGGLAAEEAAAAAAAAAAEAAGQGQGAAHALKGFMFSMVCEFAALAIACTPGSCIGRCCISSWPG